MRNYTLYKIENVATGKPYFGISCEVEVRWLHHRGRLRNNMHGNPELQEDYNKGFDFTYSILIEELTKTEAEVAEIGVIQDNKHFVYNYTFSDKKRPPLTDESRARISAGRKGVAVGKDNHFYGRKHSEESIQKMKKTLSKQDRSGGNNSFAKRVEIDEVVYGSVKEAREASGLSKRLFYKAIRDEDNSRIRYLS